MWNRLFCTGRVEKTEQEKVEPPAIIKARELAVKNRERNADSIDQKHIVRHYWAEKE